MQLRYIYSREEELTVVEVMRSLPFSCCHLYTDEQRWKMMKVDNTKHIVRTLDQHCRLRKPRCGVPRQDRVQW